MFKQEAILLKRIFSQTVMVAIGCLLVIVSAPSVAQSQSAVRLQSAGERWGSSRVWTRYRADQRSFRFDGIKHRGNWNNRTDGFRITSNSKANRGATVRSNLPSSQRTVRRSWGTSARYSSRQRIISYRNYKAAGQIQRGSTIGVRR